MIQNLPDQFLLPVQQTGLFREGLIQGNQSILASQRGNGNVDMAQRLCTDKRHRGLFTMALKQRFSASRVQITGHIFGPHPVRLQSQYQDRGRYNPRTGIRFLKDCRSKSPATHKENIFRLQNLRSRYICSQRCFGMERNTSIHQDVFGLDNAERASWIVRKTLSKSVPGSDIAKFENFHCREQYRPTAYGQENC